MPGLKLCDMVGGPSRLVAVEVEVSDGPAVDFCYDREGTAGGD